MLARVHSSAVLGIDGVPLAVEVDNYHGMNKFTIVGLPDLAVKESQERVSSAIKNSGFRFPRGIIVVNLAPADIRKEGSALDLPIAIGLLAASEQNAGERFGDFALAGELALDGAIRPVTGALCMAIAARDLGLQGIVLPAVNAEEAGVVPGLEVIPVSTLNEAAAFMGGAHDIAPCVTNVQTIFEQARRHVPDLTDVKGQAHVKRALTVAAAGGHSILIMWRQCQHLQSPLRDRTPLESLTWRSLQSGWPRGHARSACVAPA
jgi:magnesium chelatase family protein